MRSTRFLAATLLALLPQQTTEPPPRVITTPAAVINGDFSSIASVRELRNGRLLVSDQIDRVVRLIDPRTGASRPVGTNGAGPGEYTHPGGLYAANGDSTYLLDRGQQRYLLIDPTGRIVDTRSFVPAGVRILTSAPMDLQRLDAAGRVYNTAMTAISVGGTASTPSGTSVRWSSLVRQNLAREQSDTLTRLQQGELAISASGTPVSTLHAPVDGWAVQPDGRVAVVRAAPYRVEWFDAGGRRVVQGPIIPHEVHRVTSADREDLARNMERASRQDPRMAPGAGAGGVSPEQIRVVRPDISTMQFADVKPPFAGGAAVITGPNGQVWVRRTLARGDSSAVFDVFDARGERIDRLRFPPRTSIVGFGANNTVYVARLDEDDMPTLEKYSFASR